jgi:hypothetical protein
MDKYLDDALQDLENMDSLEADNHIEHLKRVAAKKGDSSALRQLQKAQNSLRSNAPRSFGGNASAQGVKGAVAAAFTLKVTRDSANIAQYLPFALFGANASHSAYEQIITPMLPSGVVLTSVAIGRDNASTTNRQKAIFTFTEGVNVDTVTVECKQVPYPDLLAATSSDSFRISQIRYSLSDSAQLAQFDEEIQLISKSIFGKTTSDTLTPSSYKAPDQYQNGIIDLQSVILNVDSEFIFAHTIKNVASFSISLNSFVERVAKVGRNLL